jgi:hypothetical protein
MNDLAELCPRALDAAWGGLDRSNLPFSDNVVDNRTYFGRLKEQQPWIQDMQNYVSDSWDQFRDWMSPGSVAADAIATQIRNQESRGRLVTIRDCSPTLERYDGDLSSQAGLDDIQGPPLPWQCPVYRNDPPPERLVGSGDAVSDYGNIPETSFENGE